LQNFMFVLADVGQPWIPPAGDIKMFRNLEQRDLMQFVDYREVLPAKDRVRRSRITEVGRAGARGANLPDCRCRDVLKKPTWLASERNAFAAAF
jgi:hypothetical protein